MGRILDSRDLQNKIARFLLGLRRQGVGKLQNNQAVLAKI